MSRNVPSELHRLRHDQVILTGATARHALGGRPVNIAPECAVNVEPGILVELGAKEDSCTYDNPVYRLGDWTIHIAGDDFDSFLMERRIPLDAIGVHPDGTVLDPLGGVEYLTSRRLSFPTEGVHSRDGLMLLAIASEQGWSITDAERAWVSQTVERCLSMPRSEMRRCLEHLLVGFTPASALEDLRRTGFLGFLLPEVNALIDFHRSSKHHHKDIWDHTCIVVRQAIPVPKIRWAALLHDIGKVHTRSYSGRGKVHFLKHDEVGAYMFEGIATRLAFPPEQAERIRLLILHHLRPGLYDGKWSDSAVRRFGEKMGIITEDLFALSRADVTSKRPGNRRRALFNLNDLKQRLEAIQAADQIEKQLVPRGLGRRIIDELGIKPGPRVGELRKFCEDAIRNGELPSNADLNVYLDYLRDRLAA